MTGSAVSRRQVLRAVGTAGATVLVAGVGLGTYRVYDAAALTPGSGQAYDPWHHWDRTPGPLGAVAAAVLAANPHNTQPWLFEVSDVAVDLFVDPARHLGSIDPYRREQHVGLGCALENLALGCRAQGLEPTVTLLPDGPAGVRVAHLDLAPAPPRTDPLHDAIGSRHTSRGAYTRQGLSATTLTGLVDHTDAPDVEVHWVTDPEPMAQLGELLVDAAQAVVDDEQQSRDGFAWFRSDDDEIQTHRDGLTLDAQGLGPVVLTAAKVLPATTRAQGDTFWVQQTREVHTATAAAYGVLTAATPDDRATQLRAGRLLQRIHLTATSQGIALQHLNQITERIDAQRVAGTTGSFAARFAELLPAGARPLVAFRVGYAERSARPSPRRLVADVATAVRR